MKSALVATIAILTAGTAVAKCDCSSVVGGNKIQTKIWKQECDKLEGNDPDIEDRCVFLKGTWDSKVEKEPVTRCTKYSAVEGSTASANLGFSCCNNMKAGSEGGKAPKCGYFESGQCKPIYIKHENVFSAEDKASNLCR